MKAVLLLPVLVLLSPTCLRAAVIIDSFDEGSFTAGSAPLSAAASTFLQDGHMSYRALAGERFPVWTATMSPGGGTLTIVSQERGAQAHSIFSIYYDTLDKPPVSLLGNDAFRLRIPSLTGTAYVRIGWFLQQTQPVFLSEPGDLYIPLSYTGWPADQTEIGGMTIWIMPVEANFSIVLDEFALVPEPSAGALGLAVLAAAVQRRKRMRARFSFADGGGRATGRGHDAESDETDFSDGAGGGGFAARRSAGC